MAWQQQFCSLICSMLAASQVGYWVQVVHSWAFAAFIPLQLSCEYGLIQSATDEKDYPRPMNHSTSPHSYCAEFLVCFCCTLFVQPILTG